MLELFTIEKIIKPTVISAKSSSYRIVLAFILNSIYNSINYLLPEITYSNKYKLDSILERKGKDEHSSSTVQQYSFTLFY